MHAACLAAVLLTLVAAASLPCSAARLPALRQTAHTDIWSFPDSPSPFSLEPPVQRLTAKPHVVSLLASFPFNSYSAIGSASYTPPEPPASEEWCQVIASLSGKVKGVQYDRFGAVWMDDLEIMRITTPEPTSAGIDWHTESDISIFLPFLKTSHTLYAAIPNVVDSTYTGILYVNVSLEFHSCRVQGSADRGSHVKGPLPDFALPVGGPVQASGEAPTDQIALNGNDTRSVRVVLPCHNAVLLRLVLFASAHGCEEFWYSNIPDKYMNATFKGNCGGGDYRHIEVYVDDVFAGVALPFPVVYTGGVNPLLWRPVTGIVSFSVPPYVFDLSPFAPALNDGLPHKLSWRVVGNNDQGVWYIDGALVGWEHPHEKRLKGSFPQVYCSGLSLSVDERPAVRHPGLRRDTPHENPTFNVLFETSASLRFKANGLFTLPDGTPLFSAATSCSVTANNDNQVSQDVLGGSYSNSRGRSLSQCTSSLKGPDGAEVFEVDVIATYPYRIVSHMEVGESSFQLYGDVVMDRDITTSWKGDGDAFAIRQVQERVASATYNRSTTNQTDVNVEKANMAASFVVAVTDNNERAVPVITSASTPVGLGGNTCYNHSVRAVNGTVTSTHGARVFGCQLPGSLRFCGAGLCGSPSLPS